MIAGIPPIQYFGAVEHAAQLLAQQSGLPVQEWRVRLISAGQQRTEYWATEDGLLDLNEALEAMNSASNELLLVALEN